MAKRLNIGGLECYADYILSINDRAVVFSWFDRSKNKTQAIGVKIGKSAIKQADYGYPRVNVATSGNYRIAVSTVKNGRSRFYSGLAISEEIGNTVLITTMNDVLEDLYNLLMQRFSLPLLKEWMPYIFAKCEDARYVIKESKWHFKAYGDEERTVTFNGKEQMLKDLEGYSVFMSEEQLEIIVSEGLKAGDIRISEKKSEPLEFKDFNDYITKYGKSLVKNLESEIEPLTELKPVVEGTALYNMRLFPQQAAAVNGIIALRKNGSKYGLLNEGMGVGKTIQALSVVEGYFNEKDMEKHACSLKDSIESGRVAYRSVIVCPGHLVNKWAQTIEEEIPQAKAIVVNDFSQLVRLRAHGKDRDCKEFYIMSKDFAKLDSFTEPIPNKVVTKHAYIKICKSCRDDSGLHTKAKGYGMRKCPECGGNEWIKERVHGLPFRGLICPECGELLIKSNMDGEKEREEMEDLVLTPADFANQTSANSVCYHCGAQLWGVSSKTMTTGANSEWFESLASRKKAWWKIRHYKNFARKNYTNSYVLKRFDKDRVGLDDYISKTPIPDDWYELKEPTYGPRKYAPAKYIKKYLRGYFDFLILDEVHKFEGAGSAQACAAHSLMKASDFTLGLTGTLLNGMASSIFYLLFMLDPARMIKKGFAYNSVMDFSKQYGCVETVHEADDDDTEYRRNSSSRGKQIGQPRVKPGISPLVYVDFLLDKAVFLDLSDLSKYLPKLYEKVEIIPQEEDTAQGYKRTIDILKASLKQPEGKKMMSYVLNFGLSYPDKPYGRKPIMSITMNDVCVANPENCNQYASGDVLLNKEQRLIEIVQEELEAGRNAFIFCSYTGDAESNVTDRLKSLIERYCNLKGRVQIITASNPQAVKREEWMHEKAADGMKVFICNPKVVETGLDFCFKHLDEVYNYPTLIFYQMSYELAVLWQASRRAYRLNQKEECRNYYLCYEGTLQQVAVQLMAEKQVATSAIQGKFSAEGLASMANGVDPRVKLAQALADGDTGDRESIENMFDVLNQNNNADEESEGGIVSLLYEEVVGHARVEDDTEAVEFVDVKPVSVKEEVKEVKAVETVDKVLTVETVETVIVDPTVNADGQISLFDLFMEEPEKVVPKPSKKAPVKKNKKVTPVNNDGQLSLFDLIA